MIICYIIDNEAIQESDRRPLTFSPFVARFFNYCIGANELIEKP